MKALAALALVALAGCIDGTLAPVTGAPLHVYSTDDRDAGVRCYVWAPIGDRGGISCVRLGAMGVQ